MTTANRIRASRDAAHRHCRVAAERTLQVLIAMRDGHPQRPITPSPAQCEQLRKSADMVARWAHELNAYDNALDAANDEARS